MVHVGPREITKNEYLMAKEKGASSLVPDFVLMGYGFYGGKVFEQEEDGEIKYYLEYDRGDSCD